MKRLLLKSLWKAVAALAVPALLYVGASLWFGLRAEHTYHEAIESLLSERGTILSDEYQRGWFRSTATTVIQYTAPPEDTARGSIAATIRISNRIQHGPLVFGEEETPRTLFARNNTEITLLAPHVNGTPLPELDGVRALAVADIMFSGVVIGDFELAPAASAAPPDSSTSGLVSDPSGPPAPLHGSFRFEGGRLNSTVVVSDGEWPVGGGTLISNDVHADISYHFDEDAPRGVFPSVAVTAGRLVLVENGESLLSLRGGSASAVTVREGAQLRWRAELGAADLVLYKLNLGEVELQCDLYGVSDEGGSTGNGTGAAEAAGAASGAALSALLTDLGGGGPVAVQSRGGSKVSGEWLRFTLDGTVAGDEAQPHWSLSDGTALQVVFSGDYLERLGDATEWFILRALDYGPLRGWMIEQGYLREVDGGLALDMSLQGGRWLINGEDIRQLLPGVRP